MNVEADFFGIRGPMLVTEAVHMFSVILGVEAVVAGCYAGVVDYICAGRILDL